MQRHLTVHSRSELPSLDGLGTRNHTEFVDDERPQLEARKGKVLKKPTTPKTPKPPAKTSMKPPKKTPTPTSKHPTGAPTPKPAPIEQDKYKVPYPIVAVDACLFINCEGDEDFIQGRTGKRSVEASDVTSHLEERAFGIKPVTQGRSYDVFIDSAKTQKINIVSLTYPAASKLYKTVARAGLPKLAYNYASTGIDDFNVNDKGLPKVFKQEWATEHILEVRASNTLFRYGSDLLTVQLQTIKEFIEYSTGAHQTIAAPAIKVPGSFFENFWNKDLGKLALEGRNKNKYHVVPGKKLESDLALTTLNHLVFEAVGSNNNPSDFVLCGTEINRVKGLLWGGKAPLANSDFNLLAERILNGGLESNNLHSIFRTVGYSVPSYPALN